MARSATGGLGRGFWRAKNVGGAECSNSLSSEETTPLLDRVKIKPGVFPSTRATYIGYLFLIARTNMYSGIAGSVRLDLFSVWMSTWIFQGLAWFSS